MDFICLEKIRLMTEIGTEEHERGKLRPLEMTLKLGVDLAPAGWSDDLTQSVNYAEVTERVIELGAQSQFFLLEAFAEHCAEMIFQEQPLVKTIQLHLVKMHVLPAVESVAVEIYRERK